MLDYKTAGESHGKGMMVIIEGLPAGIEVDRQHIRKKMARRQGGYGRGGRMKIEGDVVDFFSGVRKGKTIGSPVGLIIYNNDWENWKQVMSPEADSANSRNGENPRIEDDDRLEEVPGRVTRPRPGHADLPGVIKYNLDDARNILERASARETSIRTAMGGLLDNFLNYFDIRIISHVIELGGIKADFPCDLDYEQIKKKAFESPLHCVDKQAEQQMMDYIDEAREQGDSLGGIIEIRTTPLPIGLGDHTTWHDRLDGQLGQAMLSIPAIKGLEIGPAFANAGRTGYNVHDEIFYDNQQGFYRKTNRAGGLEGGLSNGQPLVVRVAMKPIPTLYRPLQSVDLEDKQPFMAGVERSDVTAVPAAGVVAEAMVSFVLARALLTKFGGDHLQEVMDNYKNYLQHQP